MTSSTTSPAQAGEATRAAGGRIRTLSRLETFYVFGSGQFTGGSALVSGELDLEALDEAFAELQRRHEALRAVVRKAGPVPEFVWTDRPPARIRVFEGEDPRTRPTGQGAVHDQAEQLSYVDVVPGGDHTRVSFFCGHTAADGTHVSALLAELWGLYTARVQTGGFPPAEVQAFPQSGEHYLNRRQYTGSDPNALAPEAPSESTWNEPLLFGENPPPRSSPELSELRRLGKADRGALARLARVEGVSTNSLVAAALIRAHVRAGEAPPLCIYPVDLREHVVPPVGSTEATNLLGRAYFGDVETGPDLVALARRIQDKLAGDLADGTIYQSWIKTEPDPLLLDKAFGCVLLLTHAGRLRIPPLPEGLSLVDIQPCYSFAFGKDMYATVFGREYTGYAVDAVDQQLRIGRIAGKFDKNAEILSYAEEELRAAISPTSAE
ncbi:MAG: phthiocerol/phthiodiolone dimycocerosyl transferase family protein [Segniliparus sp.]|uniref:phthiocerol/phthiodiolone dimycocerosyl transferase family protein n=1 Tax=Segniliparus sp. TaxID=2804064 RepID=UPI003F3062B6